MYKTLLQRLNQLVLLNPKQQKDLCKIVQAEVLPKGYFLLKEGQVANYIYFVVEGIIRSFCYVDGKEVTRWFGLKGHFCTPYFSFIYRKPSEDNIVLITDCQLLCLSYEGLKELLYTDRVWIDLNRRLLEHYYTTLLKRTLSFQTQSTAERYDNFLQEHPGIEDEIMLGHLASYLGMTQETLSRLRARRRH